MKIDHSETKNIALWFTAQTPNFWTGPKTYGDAIPKASSRFGSSVSINKELFAAGAPYDISGTTGIAGGSVSIFDVYYSSNTSLSKVFTMLDWTII